MTTSTWLAIALAVGVFLYGMWQGSRRVTVAVVLLAALIALIVLAESNRGG